MDILEEGSPARVVCTHWMEWGEGEEIPCLACSAVAIMRGLRRLVVKSPDGIREVFRATGPVYREFGEAIQRRQEELRRELEETIGRSVMPDVAVVHLMGGEAINVVHRWTTNPELTRVNRVRYETAGAWPSLHDPAGEVIRWNAMTTEE